MHKLNIVGTMKMKKKMVVVETVHIEHSPRG